MVFIAPFFAIWTIYGSVVFAKINSGDAVCDSPHQKSESYAFLIFWFILSYVLIFSYCCLIAYGYSQLNKSAMVKKSTLQLLRRVNHDNEMQNEMYENALTNI